MAEGQKQGDRLRIDYINSLPQPLWAETWKGDKWPVETICVQTGLVQCDIGGKIQTYQFEDITHFIDDEGAVHDPGTFEIDREETMTLREQFEAWCKRERNHTDVSRVKKYPSVPGSVADEYMNPVVELAWQAFQAGYEAHRKKLASAVQASATTIGEDGEDESE